MKEIEILRQQIIQIATMSEDELEQYQRRLSLSQISDKAKSFLFKAVDIALTECYKENHDIMAVSSNIKEAS